MVAELDGIPVTTAQMESLALTSYGHFTSMRVDDGGVRGLDLHMARLRHDAMSLFGVELDTGKVRSFARRAAPDSGAVVVRVTIYDPDLNLGHPETATQPRVLVTSRPAGSPASAPINVHTCTYERDLPDVKSTGLFATIAHRRAARQAGYDDALFTTRDGFITEGATWNIGFYDGSGIVWPRGDILPGVTLSLLQSESRRQRHISLDDVRQFSAAFATNAAIGIRAISSIDGHPYDANPAIIADLRELYLKITPDTL